MRKKKTMMSVELDNVITLLRALFGPIVDSITNHTEFTMSWNHELLRWEQAKPLF